MAGDDDGAVRDVEGGDRARGAVVVGDGIEDVEAHHRRVIAQPHPQAATDDVEGAHARAAPGDQLAHARHEVEVADVGAVSEVHAGRVQDHHPDAHPAADPVPEQGPVEGPLQEAGKEADQSQQRQAQPPAHGHRNW